MAETTKNQHRLSKLTMYMLRKLWTLMAIFLVVIALLMSFLRYSLPLLNDQKQHVEQYIADTYSVDFKIGELLASWQGNGPVLLLKDVSVEQDTDSPLSIMANEVLIEIDFWTSLSSRKLQNNQVVLNELSVTIDLTQIETKRTDFPVIDALENVFLVQLSSFEVSDSKLNLISQQNSKTIDIHSLAWLNKGNRHQGEGELSIKDFSENNASFILDLYGDAQSYSGTLFAQAQDINLSAWINEFTGLKSQLASSKGNLEVWAQVDSGGIKRIDGKVLPTTFEWATADLEIPTSLSASFAAVHNEQRWDFSIADLFIETQGKSFNTDLLGYYTDENGVVIASTTAFAVESLLPLAGLASVNVADKLALLGLQANVESFILQLGEKGPVAQANIRNLSWQEFNETLGVEELQAELMLLGSKAKLSLSAENARVKSNHYFERELSLSNLDVPIWLDFADEPMFRIENAQTTIEDITFTFSSEFASASRFLSLHVDIDEFALDLVPKVLPKHLLSNNTLNFLRSAFPGDGVVENANLLWHGDLKGFPFADNTGVFQSQLNIGKADFSFSSEWPALRELDIQLNFENRRLTMLSPTSTLGNVVLQNLRADIPNLTTNALLTINASGGANSQDVTELMMASSLAGSLGKLLSNDVVIDGELSTQLDLVIPLSDSSQTRAKGYVALNQNNVSIPAINVSLQDVVGKVVFDNELININALQASFLDQGISVDITGEKLPQKYQLNTTVNANWDISEIAKNVSDDFATYIDGKADWELAIELDLYDGNFEYEAFLRSDLVGVQTTFPGKLAKERDFAMPFLLSSVGNRIASSIELDLADVLEFDGALPHKEQQFNRAHLAIGPTELETRGLGFSISADFEDLDFEQWYPFITTIINAGERPNEELTNKPRIFDIPKRIFIDTERLRVGDMRFSDVDLTIKRLDDHWGFDIDANEMRANVSLYDERYSKGVVIDAEYIRLTKQQLSQSDDKQGDAEGLDELPIASRQTQSKLDIDPKALPSINFTCKACEFNDVKLGRVEVEAEPNSDGLAITQFLVNNQKGNINASGQWYKRNQDHYTFLGGALDSADFGSFLNELGLDSGIQDSSAQFSFAFTWQNSPADFSFDSLNGEVDWRLGDGYLTEVSDQGSRIFTLLSLNSLVRKLSLDFRDVFAKGFFYDDMQGTIQITDGKADTRDTNIDGAAGEIEIYGYTDLVNQELNYNVSFTPNVTGNLPILVYFFTVSPPSALAALALDQVLTSTKVISNINYSVTGTIKEPVLLETGRESTDVELPARRNNLPKDDLPPFVPPTEDDLIKIEVNDGQSD